MNENLKGGYQPKNNYTYIINKDNIKHKPFNTIKAIHDIVMYNEHIQTKKNGAHKAVLFIKRDDTTKQLLSGLSIGETLEFENIDVVTTFGNRNTITPSDINTAINVLEQKGREVIALVIDDISYSHVRSSHDPDLNKDIVDEFSKIAFDRNLPVIISHMVNTEQEIHLSNQNLSSPSIDALTIQIS